MNKFRQKITLKVMFSYLILVLLVIIVGGLIYREINSFTRAQQDDLAEKNKIIQIGKLLTLMYESESFARAAIQSRNPAPLEQYLAKNDSILISLDSLQRSVSSSDQELLLDSIRTLLNQKINNISDLREIRQNDNAERILSNAIAKLSTIEARLGVLTLKDFAEHPESLKPDVRDKLSEAIGIWNKYIPRDSSNTVDQKTLDSIVIASRGMLEEIRKANSRQKLSVAIKENQLLSNDLIATQQLRQILTEFETEFMASSREAAKKRERVLSRSIRVIAISAVVAGILMLVFSFIILSDFWKSQQYREALEQSNTLTNSLLKSREQLISMVSHDLRTPLNTILGYLELIKGSTLTKKQEYYTERISSSAAFITQLVDDLLDYTKLESGKISVEHIPFRLDMLIEETAESIRSINLQKPITLELLISPAFQQAIISDPFRIRQILSNLIGNAYKFTDQGQITITAEVQKNHSEPPRIAISVSDTGIGISEEKQKIIFEEFTQAENNIERKYGGSGLGLTISQKLATLLDGQLELHSVKGEGSTFTFSFPALFSEKELMNVREKATPRISGSLKAAVVDDDETLLSMITEYLTGKGCQVFPFSDASTALNKLPELRPDVVVTDIQLPGMNGFRFAELLKSVKGFDARSVPLIAVTGRKDLEEKIYLDAGFSAFLLKPYAPDQLIATMVALRDGTFKHVPKQAATEDLQSSSASYDLKTLRSFLGEDQEAIWQVIDSFEGHNKKDLKELRENIKKGNLIEISNLGHKMQTMFRQIHAGKVTALLQELEELKPEELYKAKGLYNALRMEINSIFKMIKAEAKRQQQV